MSLHLTDLLMSETIKLIRAADNWKAVVDAAGKMLLDQGFIDTKYIDAMKDVVMENGPYIVIAPGIALLHADSQEHVNEVCLGLVKLEHPIRFGHPEYDPVDLAFVLGATDDQAHTKALAELAEMLVDERRVSRIRTANTKRQLLQALNY